MLCDFDVYQASVNGMHAKSELALSGDVVKKIGLHTFTRSQLQDLYRQYFSCWDKANKRFVEVEMPYIVGAFTKFMGGVNLLDSFAAKYKSYCWYLYIFWQTIIKGVINAWLLYKQDCKGLNVSKKETLNRRQFQAQLASSLILVSTTPIERKSGRTFSSHGSSVLTESAPTDNGRPSS